MSDRCNLRCAHCYQEDYRGDGEGLADWLPRLEQFRAYVQADGSAPAIPTRLTLTGGEPLALADFPALVERIAALKQEFGFAVLTNGTLIDREVAGHLAAHGPAYVQVSIDGSAATHDAIRGAGSHARAVEGLAALVAAGVHTFISFTAMRSNWREFPEVARLACDLGVARVWSDRLIPAGQSAGEQALTPDETRQYLELMAETRSRLASSWRRRRTEVALHRALQFLVGGDAYRCKAGDSLLAVMPNGDVMPCRRLPVVVGNLAHASLADIVEAPLLQQLRSGRQPDGCRECLYSGVCQGGLRCLAYAVSGRIDACDPGCWLASPKSR